MNFLDTTAGSTHATNVAITTYMPPEHATTVFAICDRMQAQQPEIDRLRAEVQRLQAMVPNPAKARRDRTQDIEDLVLLALDNATLRVAMAAVHPCFRTGKVRDHLLEHKDRYGIRKPPSRDKIREVLIKHGYMF